RKGIRPAPFDRRAALGHSSPQSALGRHLSAARGPAPTQSIPDVTSPFFRPVIERTSGDLAEGRFMPRTLGPRATLDSLKKDAKRWLKALREGDAAARNRLRAAWPGAPGDPGLREVQQALAREYGFAAWAMLKVALADRALAAMPRDELAAIVLGGAWDDGDRAAAARIATRHPDLA